TQGRGRGRGTIHGVAQQDAWTTVMITSGEQRCTSHTQDGGSRARVLGIWGSPFGEASERNGRIARKVARLLMCHYGHAGPLFVTKLIENRALWPEWQATYDRCTRKFEKLTSGNIVASRMAAHLAAISVTSQVIDLFLEMPWESRDPVEALWEE